MRLLIAAYVESVPFTAEVLARESSLGGSESACLGLMEALAARGHQVHIFAAHLDAGLDVEWRGVQWHHAEELWDTLPWLRPDVFVSLRAPGAFMQTVPAALNVFWAQDLLSDPAIAGAMAQVDRIAYVSQYHRHEWETVQPCLKSLGWVTRNGIDLTDLPVSRETPQAPRFLYASRPERGLGPLLQMWPEIRRRLPTATLALARYRSMYDGEGTAVAQMCASFDARAEAVNHQVGGIEWLGHLSKRDLYAEMSRATALLYPGIKDFAETNGIVWTEAQACGLPIVASWKGAAPETCRDGAAILIDDDAESPAYQHDFIEAAVSLAMNPDRWAAMSRAGLAVRETASHQAVAAEWDAQIHQWFSERYAANKIGVLRQLLWQDHHVAARKVATELVTANPAHTEATDALDLCDRVIRQEAQTEADYATHAIQDGQQEANTNRRLQEAAGLIAQKSPRTILDVACGNGAMAIQLARQLPEAQIAGYDYSAPVLSLAVQACEREGLGDRVVFRQARWDEISETAEAVFCGEFLEHVELPWLVLDALDRMCQPGGDVVLTVPAGPFVELLAFGTPRQYTHVHAFSVRDLAGMLQHKPNVRLRYLPAGISSRGNALGYWLIAFEAGSGQPAEPLDYAQTITTTRPYQRLAAFLIAKDEANTIRACLQSIRPVVDRIVVLDTGSTDGTQAIARAEGAEVVQGQWGEDFSQARNQALALVESRADWVLWIDADERLEGGPALRRYLTGAGPFIGYALHQVHLMADAPTFFDRPVRVFKTGQGVTFYGVVHEQPEQAPDKGIHPAIELGDVSVLHYGYPTDRVRRAKMLSRNLALLTKELQSESPRQLAYALQMRDLVNVANVAREEAGGVLTETARRSLLRVVDLQRAHFADPAHPFHDLASVYYAEALALLGQGWAVGWGFVAEPGVLSSRPTLHRFHALTPDELQREIAHQIAEEMTRVAGVPVDCTPVVVRQPGQWEAPC